MELGEQLQHFKQFHRYQELTLSSIANSNDLIYELKLCVPQRQRHVQDFFK